MYEQLPVEPEGATYDSHPTRPQQVQQMLDEQQQRHGHVRHPQINDVPQDGPRELHGFVLDENPDAIVQDGHLCKPPLGNLVNIRPVKL